MQIHVLAVVRFIIYTMYLPVIDYRATGWGKRVSIQCLACVCIKGGIITYLTSALDVKFELKPLYLIIDRISKEIIRKMSRSTTVLLRQNLKES